MNKVAIVKRLDGGWALYTRDGKRVLGKHDKAQDAYKQEYAIEKSKERQKAAAPAADPSPAQIDAGNYKKEHLTFQGLRLAIENLKGSTRKGIDRGTAWSVKMPADYGYVKSHEGKDGDDVDVYVGPKKDSFMVYVVNQKNLGTGRFDEHKCMLGFKKKKEAIATYLKGFSDGSGIRRIMGVKSMTIPQFKAWLQTPANLKKQASAKEVLKEFVAETFGKTARLKKTAGVEIKNMSDVATAVKAFMAKQGQFSPEPGETDVERQLREDQDRAFQNAGVNPELSATLGKAQGWSDYNKAFRPEERAHIAQQQTNVLKGWTRGPGAADVKRVNDYAAGRAETPYMTMQEQQDAVSTQRSAPPVQQATPGPARPTQSLTRAAPTAPLVNPRINYGQAKPSDYMMGGRLFGQQPSAPVAAQVPQAATQRTRDAAYRAAPMANAVTDPNDLQSKLHTIQRYRHAASARGASTDRIDAVYKTYTDRMNQIKAKPGTPVPTTHIPPAKAPTQVQAPVKAPTIQNTSPVTPIAK